MDQLQWVPTPAFLYRNYLYLKLAKRLPLNSYFLDLGPGNGDFVKKLLALGFTGEAIDYSPSAIAFMKKHLGTTTGIKIILGDLFKFSPSKKYDVVFAFEVFEHIKQDALGMKKVFSLVKTGGYFIMSVPAHMSYWAPVDELKGHYRRYERPELTSKLTSAGFLIQTFWSYGFPILNLIRLFSGGGKLITSHIANSQTQRTEESSIVQEYNPILVPIITSPVFTVPLFFLMDLFLTSDLGQGYLVVAKKVK